MPEKKFNKSEIYVLMQLYRLKKTQEKTINNGTRKTHYNNEIKKLRGDALIISEMDSENNKIVWYSLTKRGKSIAEEMVKGERKRMDDRNEAIATVLKERNLDLKVQFVEQVLDQFLKIVVTPTFFEKLEDAILKNATK